MVLLKGFDHDGFAFFTNYESRKSQDLAANPYASLVFWWRELERQVRIEGVSERLDGAAADEYFRTRPRESQLGAWASPQSRPLSSRAELEARLRAIEQRYPADVPRPRHWGGFRLRPDQVEFWQGRTGRLHDRLRYTKGRDNWIVERLAP
jgi:pyridoxamine 5'-phosphate oxidase